MSELKVWVDGKERVIRGVSEGTTCESVVLVLAKAAGKSGKVALLEKWREFERILPRNENPVKCLEAWGTHKTEVCLILQDDEVPKNTIDLSNKGSINFGIDDKYDLIKRSVDCQSLESLTALQERKLKRLSRAVEILDFQFSCWDDDDEKFLYLTEDEIVEDFSLKLSQAVKLQAKELGEFDSWQIELGNLQKSNEKLVSKFQLYSDKISQLESEIVDTYDGVIELLTAIENDEHVRGRTSPGSTNVCSDIQNELRVLQHELDEQERLSHKQNKEFDVIENSVSELTKAFQLKSSKIERLRNEVTSDEIFYDLDEHFRPLSPEEESRLYTQLLSSESVDNKLSTYDYNSSGESGDNETLSKFIPEVKSGSNSSRLEDVTDFDLSRKSSAGSPEEFFRNWSSSTRLANSPLNHYHLVNGVNTKSKHSWSSLPSKSKTDLQTSSKQENGINQSTTTSNGKVEFPFSGSRNKKSLDKYIDAKVATSMNPASMMHESSSPMHNGGTIIYMSHGYSSKESSRNKTKLHDEMRTESVDKKVSSISLEKDELLKRGVSRTSPNPPTKPKPARNGSLSSRLAQSSTLRNQQIEITESNPLPQELKKPDVLPPATLPKPQRKPSSRAQTSLNTGVKSLLSNRVPDKAYLLPPTVQHKRNHHRKEKPLSHDDLCEEGVFV